ncbi:hydrolase [Altererythrobacter sp. B11]|uniref:HAD family hydrolase n=1 Tax=Altererythrobacter sp. B11 TaxID=2060312 RepID=UPI000DC6E501|nr:HAD family hydrolase [Altererythrobacter sp. B11]BBC72160.1 hydrolase [Altererythrobacter sp. B11]
MTASLSPHDFDGLLDRYPAIRCLSLDCFDTLLWRDTHAPRDLFHALEGTTIVQRSSAESHARRAALATDGSGEVTIEQIYAQLMPLASPTERLAAIEAEIAAEARHCFAFAPTVHLMMTAKARGLQLIVVSDTYFSAEQLRTLIARSAGDEVAGLIDRIFCSSEFGKAKAGGLFGDVIGRLKLPPETVLHLGDNASADVQGVAPFGVNALHLAQFSESAAQRLRLEAAADRIVHPAAPVAGSPLPHRAALSIAEPLLADPAERLGATLLGPVLHGFERWLGEEARALEETRGGKVHWLFLMRDGYLPMQVHALSGPHDNAHAVEISRFTSIAASLTSDRAVSDYVERQFGTGADILGRQLLMPEERIKALCAGRSPAEACFALAREARSGPGRKATVRAARGYADRLVAHVAATVRPDKGDTLMFIDLGYNGSVQNHVAALLEERLGVHVAGRYLLLRETYRTGLDKKGLISGEHYDAFTLEAYCSNVAVLEQLCTSSAGSVVDYQADGTPIRRDNAITPAQNATREKIQAGCLKFQAFAGGALLRQDRSGEAELWRKGAASVLARMMFLPVADELAVIERFEHDINLGGEATTGLFDKAEAGRALRQRGLFYMNNSERMYLPAELQGQGLATRLSLLTQRRFGLPLTFSDMADATIDLPVVFADREQATPQIVTATATHDGFFLAAIPVGAGQYSVALQFGALFDWFELDSLSFHRVDEFLTAKPDDQRLELAAEPELDGITRAGGRLMQADSATGFVMVHPPQIADPGQMLLACVFRPTVVRQSAADHEIAAPAGAVARAGSPAPATELLA